VKLKMMESAAGQRHPLRLMCMILALVTLLVYLPATHYPFAAVDDPDYVSENRMVQAGLTWTGVKWAFATGHASNWHPLTWLSLMLDAGLFGLNAGAHHLVNVLFHAANSVLLFLLLVRATRALWPSALVAALFAWHPLHVESVAWIAERKDVLSTFFGMLTLWAYVRCAQTSEVSDRRADVRSPAFDSRFLTPGGCWLAFLFFAAGLMAKPMLVTLPFVLLLLDYWPLGRIPGPGCQASAVARPLSEEVKAGSSPLSTIFRLALGKWPFFILTAISCTVTFLVQRKEAVATLQDHSIGIRLSNALVSYLRYLLKTFWPADLALIYPLPNSFPLWQAAASAAVLAAISMFVWLRRRRNPYLWVGWLWFLGTLVPVIGLVQVGAQAMADRYTYIPLIGIFIAVAFGARDGAARLRANPATLSLAAGLVLTGCLIVTARQLRYWQDNGALLSHTLALAKDDTLPHIRFRLGYIFEQQGRRDEALAQYREALRISESNLRLADALLPPSDRAHAHLNLGTKFERYGDWNGALVEYREAVRLDAGREEAHERLGAVLVKLGQSDEGLRECAEALRLKPDNPKPYYIMGTAHLGRGRIVEAIIRFRDALRLDTHDFQSLTCLARVLASNENPQVRNGAEAVALAERANTLTSGEQPFVLDALAMAYAETRRFDDAQRTVRRAIDLAAAAAATNMLAPMQERLRLYQSGEPYREVLNH
jgi:protein O-mannosyl-transferase